MLKEIQDEEAGGVAKLQLSRSITEPNCLQIIWKINLSKIEAKKKKKEKQIFSISSEGKKFVMMNILKMYSHLNCPKIKH